MARLQIPCCDVVDDGVAEHMFQRLVAGNVDAFAPDDDGEFHFEVQAVSQMRMALDVMAVSDDGAGCLGKELDCCRETVGGPATRQVSFDDVLTIIATHTEDIPCHCQRRQY